MFAFAIALDKMKFLMSNFFSKKNADIAQTASQ